MKLKREDLTTEELEVYQQLTTAFFILSRNFLLESRLKILEALYEDHKTCFTAPVEEVKAELRRQYGKTTQNPANN